MVQVVRLISRGLGFAPLVIGRRRTAVADRIVIEVLGEARDRLAILRTAGRNQLAAGVVGVGVDRAREVAERAAALGDGSAAAGGGVSVVELGDDVGRGGVTDLQELVVGVVGPAGRETVRVGDSGSHSNHPLQLRQNVFHIITHPVFITIHTLKKLTLPISNLILLTTTKPV